MKLFTRSLSVIALTSIALLFSCGGDGGSDAPPEKGQLKKLSKTWVLASRNDYTFNGFEWDEAGGSTQIDADFSITFSGSFNSDEPEGPYEFEVTGTNSPSPLPPSGEWIFVTVDGNSGQIILEEGLAVNYTLQSNGNLMLTFDCGEGCNFDGARKNSALSIDGAWVFDLIPD